jgi:hypothetical protein
LDSATHIVTFTGFCQADDALALLVQHGYKKLEGSLEKLVPKTVRLVAGKAFGLGGR